MKKLFIFILFSFLFIPLNVLAVDFDINSTNAILYNLNDDSVLYEKDSKSEVSIASLTKIMTCIVALEKIDNLDSKVVLTNSDFKGLYEANASVAGFRVGEEVTYRDLLYGLMLPSGADAALALTRLISGSEEEYIKLMNEKAKELKLQHTHFVNPTGLDIDGHYSSVEDVATIFKYALKNEEFYKIISTMEYDTSNGRLHFKSTIKKNASKYNLNIGYLIGGKTGTTGDAGLCLASIAECNGVKYLLVTTGASMGTLIGSFYDQMEIYEYFMNNYSYKNIINKGQLLVEVPTLYAKDDYVYIKASDNIEKYLSNDYDKNKVKIKYNGIDIIKYNMKKNEKLGTIDIIYDDNVLDSFDVFLPESQKFDLVKYLSGHIYIVVGGIILFLLIIFVIIFRLSKRKEI